MTVYTESPPRKNAHPNKHIPKFRATPHHPRAQLFYLTQSTQQYRSFNYMSSVNSVALRETYPPPAPFHVSALLRYLRCSA